MPNLDTRKKPAPQDWHRADIKAALEKRGTSLERLSRLNDYHRSAGNVTLYRAWPKMERLIASALDLKPGDIWPSRYHEDGCPKGPRRRMRFLKHSTAFARRNLQTTGAH